MYIKKLLIRFLIILTIHQISYASNSCPKWFPLPSDGLVVVIPIYDANIIQPDLDCDGIIDIHDSDIDGDGVANNLDAFPRNPSESIDTDHDGVGNNADLDDDNDGYSDSEEIIAGSNPLDANDRPMNDAKRIFIIGSSTVHAGHYRSGEFNDPYGNNRVLEGWGEELNRYAKDPSKIYNRARSGAHSISYREPDTNPNHQHAGFIDRYWDKTEELIESTNDNKGGFLFIQFGANDAIYDVPIEDFKSELRAYIQEAKDLHLTPVLISPPGARSHGTNTRPYARHVKDVSTEEDIDVLHIDLYAKSKAIWSTYQNVDAQGHLPNADIKFSYQQYASPGINNTHFGRNGAKIVAGWVRELACQSYVDRSIKVQNIAKELCQQFVHGGLEHLITMREDAEDGDTQDWERYATTDGTTVTNVYDEDKRSQVIQLEGNDGLSNGFRYSRQNLWEEEHEHVISWEMKYNEDFTFFVSVDTEDGYKTFEYKPTNSAGSTVSGRYRFGVGTDANDNTWHTFTRDLQVDLQVVAPGKHILKIHRIAIRGSGKIDNIRTMMSVDSVSRDIAPTVAVKGEAEITVNKNSVYVDAGVTVVDDNDANIASELETFGIVDTSTSGKYTILYKVHDSVGNGGYAKRIVNVLDADASVVVVHEDAENGDTAGWETYGTKLGSTFDNVLDNGNHVIELHGDNGLSNGFSFSVPAITEGFVASWRLKYSNDFRFFVQVRSTASPDNNIYMEYTPDDISRGSNENGNFIHNGLGVDTKDGTWHTFTRDIKADFHAVYPNDSITQIVGFAIRGSGRIDDISTSTRAPKETFSYNGHSYKIVKTAIAWQDASDNAEADGGYLANIENILENHEIYSRLYRYITKNEYVNTDTTLSNGGGASYVWIGANDLDRDGTVNEGKWIWEDNKQQFWEKQVADGHVIGGLYNNWGRNKDEIQKEPDNAGNTQDAAAIALTDWKLDVGHLGQASQWNDLRADTELYYVIEYDNRNVIVLNELKAFPTAAGAGAGATGGRGGDVVYVTNRDADGNGSLRQALRTEGKRTIVFAIGGRFNIDRGLILGDKNNNEENNYPNDKKFSHFTLAGQTANTLGGVHLAHSDERDSDAYITHRNEGGKLTGFSSYFGVYNQENMILRYFDSRYNWNWFKKRGTLGKEPTLKFVRVNDLIMDHITSGWSSYGLIILNKNFRMGEKTLGNITVQRSLMHENIVNPNADEMMDGYKYQKNHNVGMLLGKDPLGRSASMTKEQWDDMGEFSIHKNAFIGLSHRFPNASGGENAKFRIVNNFIYGFKGDGTGERVGRLAGTAQNDLIANVYQRRPYQNHNGSIMDFASNNLYGYLTNETPDNTITKANCYIINNLFLNSDGTEHTMTNDIRLNSYLMLYDYTQSNPNHLTRVHLTSDNAILRDNPIPSNTYPVSILSANKVKDNLLRNVGGNVRFNEDGSSYIDDEIDNRYIGWAKNNNGPTFFTNELGDGGIGDSVGVDNFSGFKYPTNANYNADTQEEIDPSILDTDKDGMPNTWELAHKLDPDIANNNAVRTDRNWDFDPYLVVNNAGYTDLEMYLSDIAGDFHMLALNK